MYYNENTAARLLNSLIAGADDNREFLKHAWIDNDGRMCACDGFRAFRLNVPVAGVPDIEAEKAIDLNKIYPQVDESKALDLPTLADVRAMIEQDKRSEKRGENVSYMFTFGLTETGEQLPAVNLGYLADALQMFPNARAYYTTPIAPIVFKDENGDAVILPVRVAPGSNVDATQRRQAPAPIKKDKAPALGLRTFAALYA